MNIQDWLYRVATRIEASLETVLQEATGPSVELERALRYAVLGGGKRLRPALVYALAEPLVLDPDSLDAPAIAVELIHVYSLIHDDLPAMDNDDFRHNRPTVHKAFDEATAILAGDALQTLAFSTLAAQQSAHAITQIACLAQAAGRQGMIGGQALDLAATGQSLALERINELHRHKSGALISAALEMAGLAKFMPGDERLTHLRLAGQLIGLSFQIRDDVLDVLGDEKSLGKTPGKDVKANKPTYASIMKVEEATHHAEHLLHEAQGHLKMVFENKKPEALLNLMQYMIDRTY